MGVTKTELFSEDINQLATLAKALGHPARIAIIEFLLKQESCICNDIVQHLNLSQATISQHLAELKSIGLISGEVKPPKVCYCLNQTKWDEVKHVFERFFQKVKCNC